jgi:hypothetical protein
MAAAQQVNTATDATSRRHLDSEYPGFDGFLKKPKDICKKHEYW